MEYVDFAVRVFQLSAEDRALRGGVRRGAGALLKAVRETKQLAGRCGEVALVVYLLQHAVGAATLTDWVDEDVLEEYDNNVAALLATLGDADDAAAVESWLINDADTAPLLRVGLTQLYAVPATAVDVADTLSGFLAPRPHSTDAEYKALGAAYAAILNHLWKGDPEVFGAAFGTGTFRSKEALTRLAEDASPMLAAVFQTWPGADCCIAAFRIRRAVCGLWWCEDDEDDMMEAELVRSAALGVGDAVEALTPRGCVADNAILATPSPLLNALLWGSPSFLAAFQRVVFARDTTSLTAAAAGAPPPTAQWEERCDPAWMRSVLGPCTPSAFRTLAKSLCAPAPGTTEPWDVARVFSAVVVHRTATWNPVPSTAAGLEQGDDDVWWLASKAAAVHPQGVLDALRAHVAPRTFSKLNSASAGLNMLWGGVAGFEAPAPPAAGGGKRKAGDFSETWDGAMPFGHPADPSTPKPVWFDASATAAERRRTSSPDIASAPAGAVAETRKRAAVRQKAHPRSTPGKARGQTRSTTPGLAAPARGGQLPRAQTTGSPGPRGQRPREGFGSEAPARAQSQRPPARRVSDTAKEHLEKIKMKVEAKRQVAMHETLKKDMARARLMVRWEENRRNVAQRLDHEKRSNTRRFREMSERRVRHAQQLQQDLQLHLASGLNSTAGSSAPPRRDETIDELGFPPAEIAPNATLTSAATSSSPYQPRALALGGGSDGSDAASVEDEESGARPNTTPAAGRRGGSPKRSPKLKPGSPVLGTRSTFLMASINEVHGRKHRPQEATARPARSLTPSELKESADRLTRYRKEPDFNAVNDKGYVVGDTLVQKYYPREDPLYIQDYSAFLGRVTKKPKKKKEKYVRYAAVTDERKIKEMAARLTRDASAAEAIDRQRDAALNKQLRAVKAPRKVIDKDDADDLIQRLGTPLDKNDLAPKDWYATDQGVFDICSGEAVDFYAKKREFRDLGGKRLAKASAKQAAAAQVAEGGDAEAAAAAPGDPTD
eukprot:TRINITY_DN11766_c0_g2_i1.p1 TRINITY_DN11766_c0_g2~~TRINITY_DN11766_c0_g2_i1.p1  ORF type:complete len:1004 (+),score=389.14 TRINITY_DN11766_c0_g2_i1:154-3165(+)